MTKGAPEGAKTTAAWTMVARVVSQGAQFATFLFAARVLGPADFGVFAIVSAIHVLAIKLSAAGWHEFMIGWDGDDESRDNAFTLATLLGLVVGALGFIVGLGCYAFGLERQYGELTLLLSAATLFVGTTACWGGLLYRRGRVSVVTKVQIISDILGAGVAIGCLLLGLGVGALGFWKLAIHLGMVVGLGLETRWIPSLRLNSAGRSRIFSYVKTMASSELILYVQANAGTLLLGVFLGAGPVGIFRAAARLVGALAEVIGETIVSVSWSVLRRAKVAYEGSAAAGGGESPSLLTVASQLLTVILLLTAPPFGGLAVAADSLVTLLLGAEWASAGPLVSIMAVGRFIAMPALLITPLLTLTSQVQYLPRVRLVTGTATVLAVASFGPFGVTAAALGQVLAAAVGTIAALRVYQARIGLQWLRSIHRSTPSLLAVAVMVVAVVGLRQVDEVPRMDMWVRCGFDIAVGMVAYGAAFLSLGGKRALLASTRFSSHGLAE